LVGIRPSSLVIRTDALAQELNAQFLYVPTDSMFDGARGNYSEDDQPAPLSIYAKSKWLGEQEVSLHAWRRLSVSSLVGAEQ
jgi:dTDP-4-dehydrorhamnose reductase